MSAQSSNPQVDRSKSLRTQQLALLGVAAVTFIIAWLDGLSGLTDTAQNIHAGQKVVMVKTRWYITCNLPLISIVTLGMSGIAYRQRKLFDPKAMVLLGTVVVSTMVLFTIIALLGLSSWIETQGYERCTTLDHIKGITRHGATNVEASAWTPIGQCR